MYNLLPGAIVMLSLSIARYEWKKQQLPFDRFYILCGMSLSYRHSNPQRCWHPVRDRLRFGSPSFSDKVFVR